MGTVLCSWTKRPRCPSIQRIRKCSTWTDWRRLRRRRRRRTCRTAKEEEEAGRPAAAGRPLSRTRSFVTAAAAGGAAGLAARPARIQRGPSCYWNWPACLPSRPRRLSRKESSSLAPFSSDRISHQAWLCPRRRSLGVLWASRRGCSRWILNWESCCSALNEILQRQRKRWKS